MRRENYQPRVAHAEQRGKHKIRRMLFRETARSSQLVSVVASRLVAMMPVGDKHG